MRRGARGRPVQAIALALEGLDESVQVAEPTAIRPSVAIEVRCLEVDLAVLIELDREHDCPLDAIAGLDQGDLDRLLCAALWQEAADWDRPLDSDEPVPALHPHLDGLEGHPLKCECRLDRFRRTGSRAVERNHRSRLL